MADRSYVLGTHDEEIDRLGLQHRVWRPRVLDAWSRAGIAAGQTVLDVGAGPGHAALDLAGIVGPAGKVVALERSERFLAALATAADERGLGQIEPRPVDLATDDLGAGIADAAWCRWVLCFLAQPQRAVDQIATALRPGGTAVFHEYSDYGAWRMLPPDPLQERFRALVMQSWRDGGGEPDIGLSLPAMLSRAGLQLVETRTHVDIVDPQSFTWRWPAVFMATNAARLADLGYVEADEAKRMAVLLDDPAPGTLMQTPLVLEIIARKLDA